MMPDPNPPTWLTRADERPARRLAALYTIIPHDECRHAPPLSSSETAGAEYLWINAAGGCELTHAAPRYTVPGTILRPSHRPGDAPSLPSLAAILSSCYLRSWVWPAPALFASIADSIAITERLRALPMPPIAPQRDAQLRLLWHFRQIRASQQERDTILEAFDRIVAEIYAMSLDELMCFDRDAG